jgi:formylglycine-generating enzyme required for sulfatase activity
MRITLLLGLACVSVLGLPAFADEPIEIPMTGVVDPHRGGVGYAYWISVYEITNTEFAAFLNAVADSDPFELYDERMATDPHGGIVRAGEEGSYEYTVKPNFADKPVNYVRWSGAIRFVNWLHNGQPEGPQGPDTTEDGAYEVYPEEVETYFFTTRKPEARWALPDYDEWKKAARFDPTKNGVGGFWVFATRSDVPPDSSPADEVGNLLNPGPNVVNHDHAANWNGSTDGNVTTVGSAGPESASYYGTYDQNGNVGEWIEMISCVTDTLCGRNIAGGNYQTGTGGDIHPLTYLVAPLSDYLNPDMFRGHMLRGPKIGFRVMQLCPPPLPGDLNGSGTIDLVDLAVLLSHYGADGDASARNGDLDCDGDVDLSDLAALLGYLGGTLDG